MWRGRPASKQGGGHAAGRLLLAAIVLTASLAGMRMLLLPARQAAGGFGAAALQPSQLSAADLSAGTPKHGHLVKRGPQTSLAALAEGRDLLDLSYLKEGNWAAERLVGSAQPFPSKWCAALYNDKYKLIFLKCPKTASTSLVSCLLCQPAVGGRVGTRL